MSERHPIIAITGSSGAGTTSVSASVSCCGSVSRPTMDTSAMSAGNIARTP